MLRIESARRLFGRIWFNEGPTAHGVEALGAYHERRDDDRQIGLGPEHDWASHGSDAFGLMCIAYEAPKPAREERGEQIFTVTEADANAAWMAG
jgi:phage terminase large subunit